MNARAFRAEMAAAGKSVQRFGDDTISAQKRMMAGARSLRQVGGGMTRHMTLPIVAAGVASAKFATDFHGEMELIHTQANLSQGAVDHLSKQVLAMRNTSQGPMELSQGLYHLASIGLDSKQSMDALRVAADGAAVGHADLESTASALSAAFLVNHRRITSTTDVAGGMRNVMSILNATIGTGRLRMDELTNALGSGILPVAKEAGLHMTDVMGVLALLTDEGFDASSAMRLLRTSLSFFTAPTEKAKKAMEGMGMSWHQLSDDLAKPRGLLIALKDLKSHLDAVARTDPAQAKAIMGAILPAGRGVPIRVLLNQIDRYGVKLDTITKKQGDFGDSIAKTRETGWFKLRDAWSMLQKAAVKLGDVMAPALASIAIWLGKAADAFMKLPAPMRKWITVAFAAIAVIGPLLIFVGAVATAIAVLATPATAVALAVAGAIAELVFLYKHVGIVRKALSLYVKAWVWAFHAVADAGAWVVQAAKDSANWVVNAWGWVKNAFNNTVAAIQAGANWIVGAWNWIISNTRTLQTIVKAAFGVWVNSIRILLTPLFILVVALRALWGVVKAVGRAIGGFLLARLKDVWGFLKGPLGSALNYVIGRWKGVGTAARDTVHWVRGALDRIKGLLSGFAGAVAGIGRAVWGGFRSAFVSVFNFIVGRINWLVRAYENTAGKIPGTPTLHEIGAIPGRRRRGPISVIPAGRRGYGGTVSRAGEYWTGEHGPERISLPPGARVTPFTPVMGAQAGAGGGGGGGHFHLYIDGRELNVAVSRTEKRLAARR